MYKIGCVYSTSDMVYVFSCVVYRKIFMLLFKFINVGLKEIKDEEDLAHIIFLCVVSCMPFLTSGSHF